MSGELVKLPTTNAVKLTACSRCGLLILIVWPKLHPIQPAVEWGNTRVRGDHPEEGCASSGCPGSRGRRYPWPRRRHFRSLRSV